MNQIQEFKLLLRLHRQQMSPKQRIKTKYIKPPHSIYPVAIEHNYAALISELQNQLISYAEERIAPLIPRLVQRNNTDHMDDSLDQEYEKLQKDLEAELVSIYGSSIVSSKKIQSLLVSVAEKTKAFRETNFSQQILAVTGVPFVPLSPNWGNIKASWELSNYTLIRGLSVEYIQKINTVVLTGVQSGWSTVEIADEIQKLGDRIGTYRAKLIARDQMGKLNNKIAKDVQMNVGITVYMWNTARDERVRGNPKGKYPKAIPSHWAMDGMLCKWSDSTVYSTDIGRTWKKRTTIMPTVEPGIEIQCRCLSSPVAVELIQEVDDLIDQQGA